MECPLASRGLYRLGRLRHPWEWFQKMWETPKDFLFSDRYDLGAQGFAYERGCQATRALMPANPWPCFQMVVWSLGRISPGFSGNAVPAL